jgi:hypothetical protein
VSKSGATLTRRRIRRTAARRRSNASLEFSGTLRTPPAYRMSLEPSSDEFPVATKLREFRQPPTMRDLETRPTTVEARFNALGDRAFEQEYARIGNTRGAYSDPRGRDSIRKFWISSDREGAEWLATRIRREHDLDVLDSVANLLADIGAPSVVPILACLEGRWTSHDQTATLLKAIGWIRIPHRRRLVGRLRRLLRQFCDHQESEIREAAAMATRCMPRRIALELLNGALASETVESVREVVEEEIAERAP